jgi:hypothetical protein
LAQEEDLDLSVEPLTGLKVSEMSPDFIEDVLPRAAADFRRQILKLAVPQVKLMQRGQQGFERGKTGES